MRRVMDKIIAIMITIATVLSVGGCKQENQICVIFPPWRW